MSSKSVTFLNSTVTGFIAARAVITFNAQMLAAVDGFFLYQLTHSTSWLAMAGLVQFIPRMIFTIPAGTLADTRDRRKVVAITQSVVMITALVYGILIYTHSITPYICMLFIFIYGSAYALQAPSTVSLLPNLVERRHFASATATVTSVLQFVTIVGPAAGGLIYIFGAFVPLFLIAGSSLVAIFLVLAIHSKNLRRDSHTAGLTDEEIRRKRKEESPIAGFQYIWRNKGILGALSLDMFAVLFGGVTALLPVFADQVLHSSSVGLGLLRAAPAVGALFMSAHLARKPLQSKMGLKMFAAVAAFGLFTIFFAFSTNIVLSLILLTFLGAADVISMVVRQTYVQLTVPDEMRGRVSAVNLIFIGASNQLGEFESGMIATAFGQNVVAATIFGGIGTLGVVSLWFMHFKELRELDHLA